MTFVDKPVGRPIDAKTAGQAIGAGVWSLAVIAEIIDALND